VETVAGELCVTKWQGIPLVRYNLHDSARLYDWSEIVRLLPFWAQRNWPWRQLWHVWANARDSNPFRVNKKAGPIAVVLSARIVSCKEAPQTAEDRSRHTSSQDCTISAYKTSNLVSYDLPGPKRPTWTVRA
jgi:hypothetical protein